MIILAALLATAPHNYQLAFAIDHRVYVSPRALTHEQCRRVLRSTAIDPDSFRNGQGVYSCRREGR